MRSDTFCTALKACSPPVADLIEIGFTDDEAKLYLSKFTAIERAEPLSFRLPDPLLNDLFARYDLSDVGVGIVSFQGEPEPQDNGWKIGQCEDDELILLESGDIVVLKLSFGANRLWACAIDTASFLDALIIAADFLAKRLTGKATSLSLEATAQSCAEAAGGSMFHAFYQRLCGDDGAL